MAPSVRERLFAAALDLVERDGLDEVTVEDVARAAGVSRATVYRHLPGGRAQLIDETVAWEVGRFLDQVTAAAEQVAGLAPRLETLLVASRHAVDEHRVLQRVLEHDREEVLPSLGEVLPIALGVLRAWLVPQLGAVQLRAGTTVDGAADYLARMVLSFLGTPGRWDLDDPAERARLVRTELLAGIVAAP